MRKPIIGVMGGSKVSEDVRAAAYRLGLLIAQRGWVLLNGGRNKGVMAASASGAKAGGGTVIGVLPESSATGASPDIDFAIITGMGDARNIINVLSSDVVIVCAGGLGTFSEMVLALKREKPVILLGLDPGPAFEKYRRRGQLVEAQTPEEAVELAARFIAED